MLFRSPVVLIRFDLHLQRKLEGTKRDVPGLGRFESLQDTLFMRNTVLRKDLGGYLWDMALHDVQAESRDHLERFGGESLAILPDDLGLFNLSVNLYGIIAYMRTSIRLFHSVGLSLVMGSIMRSDRIDHLCVFVRDVGSTLAS